MLTDFDLSSANLIGGMSDAGPDVKWMLQSGLNLQWEWYLAHLSNAATKTACDLVNNKKDSKNPGMTELLDKVCKTVRQARDSEVLGDLFKALCEMEGHERATMLIDYKSHRFLGITRVVERMVDRWNELTRGFEARQKKARADGKVPRPFLLEDYRLDLVQLMSLLKPITVLNQKSQSDSCSQVDSLLHVYRLRLQTLNTTRPLRDYRSPPTQPAHFGTNELTPIVQKTRELLAAAFDKNFFSRYTDRSKLRQQSFVLEMQLLLYPTFNNLDLNLALVTRLCYAKRDSSRDACERMGNLVRDAVIGKARAIILAMAADDPPLPVEAAVSLNASDDEIIEMFGAIAQLQMSDEVREGQIDEEIQRWRAEPAALGVLEDGAVENILQFWQRQAESGNYKLLPKLAGAVFALPSSSAQIERDFGLSGLMVRAQRADLSSCNIEMSTFLSCNRSLINVAQCRRIPPSEISNHIPSHIIVGALDDHEDDEEFGSHLATYFSGATLGDDDEDTI